MLGWTSVSRFCYLLVLRVPISVRVHRLPFPGVSAHLLNAVLSFPAEFIFRFGSIGVAGCDIATCYSDATKAKNELGWEAQYGIEEMCADSWKWQSMNPNGYRDSED